MGPDELKTFNFKGSGINVLGEKMLNGTLKLSLKPELFSVSSPSGRRVQAQMEMSL